MGEIGKIYSYSYGTKYRRIPSKWRRLSSYSRCPVPWTNHHRAISCRLTKWKFCWTAAGMKSSTRILLRKSRGKCVLKTICVGEILPAEGCTFENWQWVQYGDLLFKKPISLNSRRYFLNHYFNNTIILHLIHADTFTLSMLCCCHTRTQVTWALCHIWSASSV